MITITINIRDVMFQCAGLNMKRRKLSCIFSLKQQSSLDLKSQECLSLKFSLQQSKAYVQDCLSVHFFYGGIEIPRALLSSVSTLAKKSQDGFKTLIIKSRNFISSFQALIQNRPDSSNCFVLFGEEVYVRGGPGTIFYACILLE